MSELGLYLVQRRGTGGPPDRAMVVGALSEAHARVAAYERAKDVVWADAALSTCQMIVPSEGVVHTIYAKDPDA